MKSFSWGKGRTFKEALKKERSSFIQTRHAKPEMARELRHGK